MSDYDNARVCDEKYNAVNKNDTVDSENESENFEDAEASEDEDTKSEIKMENFMRPPTSLSFEGNLKEKWENWYESFEIYMEAADLQKKTDTRKIAILLNLAGQEAREKFKTFGLSQEDAKKYTAVVKAFEDHCTPKKNLTVERHLFFTRVQDSGENFSSFFTDLRKLSASCEFGDLKDSLITDRIICGINNPSLKNKLLREENLTLENCTKFCKAVELAELQLKTVNNETKVYALNPHKIKGNHKKSVGENQNQIQKNNEITQSKQKNMQDSENTSPLSKYESQRYRQYDASCRWCGSEHKPRQCPAYGKYCSFCGGRNHLEVVCEKKNNVDEIYDYGEFIDDTGLFIG